MASAIYFSVLVVMFAGAFVHLKLLRKKLMAARIFEILLLWVLAISGVQELWRFYGHVFMSGSIAAYMGFPAGSPFQFEVGIAHLTLAVLGILCIWIRGSFWIATVIAFSIINFGAAIGHIIQILYHYNFSPGNAGFTLYFEILTPIISITFLIAYMNAKKFPKGV